MTPERTGRTATCPRCRRPDVPTEISAGQEVLAMHAIAGGTVTCPRRDPGPIERRTR